MAQRKNETKSEYYKRKYLMYEKPRRDRARDKFNAQRRDHYQRFKNKITTRNHALRWKDIDSYNAKERERTKTEQHRASRRRLRQHKHDTDIQFRLMETLRSRTGALLRGTSKSANTIKLLGCDAEFFRKYLESKFESWMNWGNYGNGEGKWSVDHVIPCMEFDLTKPEQQRMCFHYTNLRPLRAKENSDWRKPRPKVQQPEFL